MSRVNTINKACVFVCVLIRRLITRQTSGLDNQADSGSALLWSRRKVSRQKTDEFILPDNHGNWFKTKQWQTGYKLPLIHWLPQAWAVNGPTTAVLKEKKQWQQVWHFHTRTHTRWHICGKRYLEVLVSLQCSDRRVRELDVVQRPVGAVFVAFSTGEPIVVLLPERSHRWLFSLPRN